MIQFSEKDIEELIFNADRDKLSERGLTIEGELKKQVRIGNYGIADMVSFERSGCVFDNPKVTIYELKKEKVSVSAFIQALNYAIGIKRYFSNERGYDVDIVIRLIGSDIDEGSALYYLPSLVNDDCNAFNIEFYKYTLSVDGIWFNEYHYTNLKNEGFKK